MANAQSAGQQNGKSGGKSRILWVIIGGVFLFLAGVAAGAGLWQAENSETRSTKTMDVPRTEEGQALLPIGKITVNVLAASALGDKKTRFLLIEPTLVYAKSFDANEQGKKMGDLQAAMRDSFIEYLSQLHEDDVYGSAGLADLRSELLRRARLVSESDAPISVLLQDFVLQ